MHMTYRSTPPPVILSSTDHDRLAALAEAVRDRTPALSETLLAEIQRSQIVGEDSLRDDVVRMGSTVEFRDEATGKVQRLRLVYPGEADIGEGRVSILTPIGTALIGLAKGQTMPWQTRSGEARELTILDVWPPEH